MDAVQERMTHCGLALKIIGKMSWGCYRIIRRVLSFDFEEPEDLSYLDKDDIGKYTRWQLQLQPEKESALVTALQCKMPALPTVDHLRAEEDDIVSRYGGYKLSRDGRTVTKDFNEVLEAILLLHWEKLESLPVVVIQVFGDGFRMFREGKYVNFCLRVCGILELSGTAASCETLAVWSGDDVYEETKERVQPAFDLMAIIAKTGEFRTKKGAVQCMVIGGGDYVWINDGLGGSGASQTFPCCYCEKHTDHFGDLKKKSTARTYKRAVAASHAWPEDGKFPINCPHCNGGKGREITEEEWRAENEKEHPLSWLRQFAPQAPNSVKKLFLSSACLLLVAAHGGRALLTHNHGQPTR